MKYNTPNCSRLCLLSVLICLISSEAFSQDTTNELTPVSTDQITQGLKCFKKNVRRGRRSKVTEQVILSYSAMQQLLNEAEPGTKFQFILVAIDKNYPGTDTIFKKNNSDKTLDDLHNHQALVVKFNAKSGTAMNQQQEFTEMTSSLKSADNPLRKITKNEKRNLSIPPTPVRYAIGRLCPPPVCDQY